jgi:hypothetical protein
MKLLIMQFSLVFAYVIPLGPFSNALTPIQKETAGRNIILHILNGLKVHARSQNCALQRRVEYKVLSSYPHLKQGTGS